MRTSKPVSHAKSRAARLVGKSGEDEPREDKAAVQDGGEESSADADSQDEESGGGRLLADDLQIGSGFDRIVDTLFTLDVNSDFEEVNASLRFEEKPSRMSFGALIDALNEAEIIAKKALVLAANSRVALKRYEADAESILGTIRNDAAKRAHQEFKDGVRAKAPTISDIEAIAKTMFHDELRAVVGRREEARQMVEVLNGMVKITSERAKDIRQMVASSRQIS